MVHVERNYRHAKVSLATDRLRNPSQLALVPENHGWRCRGLKIFNPFTNN